MLQLRLRSASTIIPRFLAWFLVCRDSDLRYALTLGLSGVYVLNTDLIFPYLLESFGTSSSQSGCSSHVRGVHKFECRQYSYGSFAGFSWWWHV